MIEVIYFDAMALRESDCVVAESCCHHADGDVHNSFYHISITAKIADGA
jgi:hypothetical protein